MNQQAVCAIQRELDVTVRALDLTRKDVAKLKMNKFIILLLAVCLVSVHAYVKRDAPETTQPDLLETAKKTLDENWEKFKDALKPEAIQKSVNDAINTVKKAISDKTPTEAPKA